MHTATFVQRWSPLRNSVDRCVYKLAIFMTLCWLYGDGDPRCGIPPPLPPCHHSPYYCAACPPPREEWSAASNECWIPGLFSVTFVSNDRAGPDWPNSDQLEWARGMAGRPDGPLVGRNTGTTPPLLCQISGCFWSISVGGPVAAITGPVAQLFTFSLFWLTSACALVALTFSLSNLSTYVLHW